MLLVVLAGRAKNKKGSYVSPKCLPPVPSLPSSPTTCVPPPPPKGAPAGVLTSLPVLCLRVALQPELEFP